MLLILFLIDYIISESEESRTTCGFAKRESKFLSYTLCGIIPAISRNVKNVRKKTGNRFLISCFGMPFYAAAVIQFLCMSVHQSRT